MSLARVEGLTTRSATRVNVMRTATGIVAVLLVQLCVACDKASPVAPIPSAPPPTLAPAPIPPREGEEWTLTSVLTSITRPARCGPSDTLRMVYDMLLTVERAGNSIHFIASAISNRSDAYEYTASLTGTEFSGGGTTPSGYVLCGEARSDHSEDRLTGRFAPDGQTLTAVEEMVFHVGEGDSVTYHFEWNATRQRR